MITTHVKIEIQRVTTVAPNEEQQQEFQQTYLLNIADTEIEGTFTAEELLETAQILNRYAQKELP